MSGARAIPPQQAQARRDAALAALVADMPFAQFLGAGFSLRGDELTATLPYGERLIGNPFLPALHGGATAGFLEATAIVGLSWTIMCERAEEAGGDPEALERLPKTIGFTVDYLRSGQPRDAYARARVVRFGRRYASVNVQGWQESRAKPFVQATGNFLMPDHA